ncbi:restriction endonuclease subunit S [Rubrolithibacter danxiaensis]|uniref:restriction endonuclease subunit S n=1 Tax=Rubrolithibacter danxiaensis TaxID=3390805 RepID=UPI003BF77179
MNKDLGLYHLPENWQLVHLEDIALFSKGRKTALTKQQQENTISYLDIEAFEKNQIKQYAIAADATLIDEKSLAMVWDGARSGLVFKGKEGALGSTLMKITPVLVKELYIYYYLQFINGYIKSHTKGTGIPHVDPQVLFKIKAPLPPIEEQERIVQKIEELFSELDDSIQKVKEAQSKLNLFQQALYEETFKRITVEREASLSEICSIVGGVTKGRNLTGKETVELPYLRVANVQDGYLNLEDVKTIRIPIKEKDKYLLSIGDILYTEGGDRDKLGRGTVWQGEIDECIHQNHIFRARPKSPDYNSNYISYYSKTKAAREYFFKSGKQTTNLASINISILSNLIIPLVSLDEQIKIVEKIDAQLSIYSHSVLKVQSIQVQMDYAKQSILKKAFNGFLVSQKSSDISINSLLTEIIYERQRMVSAAKNEIKKKPKKTKITMNNKDIIEILQASQQSLSAKEVWESSRYKGDIEKFYAALKKISHLIKEDPKGFISLREK